MLSAQAGGGVGAELGLLGAEKAGFGPVGQLAASLGGAILGGAAGNAAGGMAAGKAGSAAAGRIGGRAAGEAAGAQAESRVVSQPAKKPDAFALTPESANQAVSRSRYAGKAGQIVEVDARELGWSQTTVSSEKIRHLPDGREIRYTYDEIKSDLYNNGWPKNKPVDAVIMPPEGELTSVDNSRLTATWELGGVDKHGRPIKPIVRIRRPDEKLTEKEKARFERKESEPPATWGDAVRVRIRGQRSKIPGQEYRLTQPPRVTPPK